MHYEQTKSPDDRMGQNIIQKEAPSFKDYKLNASLKIAPAMKVKQTNQSQLPRGQAATLSRLNTGDAQVANLFSMSFAEDPASYLSGSAKLPMQ